MKENCIFHKTTSAKIISVSDNKGDVENILNFIHHYYCIECSAPMINWDMSVDGDFGVTAEIDKEYHYIDSNGSSTIQSIFLGILWVSQIQWNGLFK